MKSSDISTLSKKMESMSMTHRVIRHNKRLPQSRSSLYTKLTNANEEQKEESIRLGVELSLFVAEAMFILSDDIRSMLLFCTLIFKHAGYKNIDDGPMIGRLINYVMLYVFETYIKPKNGVYQNGERSIHWGLYEKSLQNFIFAIRELNRVVLFLGKREGSAIRVIQSADFRQYNQELKMLEETFRSFKDVSKANGFAREEIKSNILHLWKSLFETPPNKLMFPKDRVLEMFRPLLNQSTENICCPLIDSLHI